MAITLEVNGARRTVAAAADTPHQEQKEQAIKESRRSEDQQNAVGKPQPAVRFQEQATDQDRRGPAEDPQPQQNVERGNRPIAQPDEEEI